MNKNENILDKWLAKNVNQLSSLPKQNKKKKTPIKNFFKQKFVSNKVKLIFFGGLDETGGKNMMGIEYKNDLIIIDMGLMFPPEDMLGVDYIVPDSTYLEKNKHKIRGILITHGHLDHIGAISYIAPKLNNPKFYSLKLTNGFIEKQLKERKLLKSTKLITVKPKESFSLGVFKITFFRVNHSISDSCGIIIDTPEGKVVHTGDFKFDKTPADGLQADYDIIEKLGHQNVLALLCESTNSTRPGKTVSEKVIGETLEGIVSQTQGRLIIACTSSLVGRMQQIINSAQKHKRKIFVSGRSMLNNIDIASKLGYLKYPKDIIKPLKNSGTESHKANALILTTGSQGEALSALTRMAFNEHAHLKIIASDTVVFSSSPIVGNERAVTGVLNEIVRKGAKVITNKHMDVHTTGHGNLEDLKTMIKYIKPKYLIPVHGEYYFRSVLKDAAISLGIPASNTYLLNDGEIIELHKGRCFVSKDTVPSSLVMVDNQSNTLSTIAAHVVSERQSMAQNGVIIIRAFLRKKNLHLEKVQIQSHGFMYMNEGDKLIKILIKETEKLLKNKLNPKTNPKPQDIEKGLKKHLEKIMLYKIQRKPLISPLITYL